MNAPTPAPLPKPSPAARFHNLLGAALCLGVLAVVFAPVIFQGHLPAFRDVSYFYYPLHYHIRELWYEGTFPGWNPYENFGVPLLAQGTPAVFYPGSWLLLLPGPFAFWWGVYLLGHLLLAAASTWWLLRRWGCSPAAAWLGALSYAYSGQVLMMYTNPPFLVSAAWAPVAQGLLWHVVAAPALRRVVKLAVVWAMIILGGDPQMVAHLGLVGLLLWWMRRRQHRRLLRQASGKPQAKESGRGEEESPPAKAGGSPKEAEGSTKTGGLPKEAGGLPRGSGTSSVTAGRSGRGGLLALAGAGVLALGLAAVQVVPTQQLVALSTRSEAPYPRNLWEVPLKYDRLGKGHPAGGFALLLARTDDLHPEHMRHIYQFSLAPWRLGELVWPGISGDYRPDSVRWMQLRDWEDRPWTLSLYLGGLPLVCALAAFRLRRGRLRRRWLAWMVLLATLASFGSYAPGWVGRLIWEARGGDPHKWPLGDGFGGLYWLLVVLVPKYVQFRYPAKWFTLATLGLALLAAQGFDGLVASGRFRRRVLGTGLVLLAASGLAIWAWKSWFVFPPPGLAHDKATRQLIAYLDEEGVELIHRLVLGAIGYAVAMLLAGWAVLRLLPRRWWPGVVLLLLGADLAVTQRRLVFTAPAGRFAPAKLAIPTPQARKAAPNAAGLRPSTDLFMWFTSVPAPRGLPSRLFRVPVEFPLDLSLSPWGITTEREALLPKWNLLYRVSVFESFQTLEIAAWRKWYTERKQETSLILLPEWSGSPAPSWWQYPLTPCWLAPLPSGVDPKAQAGQPLPAAQDLGGLPKPLPAKQGEARFVLFRPGQMDCQVRLHEPAVLVLPWQHYPGWQAWRIDHRSGEARRVPIHRANKVMQAVVLPPGRWRVRLVYRSGCIFWGLVASAACWLVAVGLWHGGRH